MWNVVLVTGFFYFTYVLLGGCLFMILHSAHELSIGEISRINVTYDFSKIMFVLLSENFTSEEVYRVVDKWDRNAESYLEGGTPFQPVWTFGNAFFFAFHLISTIGYGNITPKTASGQTLSVIYAVIGIPLHILFLKLLGQSFVQSYEETVWRIKGDEDSETKKMLSDLLFFLSWTIIFFIVPSIVFMFTEDWNFFEGIYYSFITLTTVGLGDYVAGASLQDDVLHAFYKVLLFLWMIYGLAYTAVIVDILTHEYQMYLLFALECKKCRLQIHRIYVDIEKLDIHFRLLRSEGVKQKFSMWALRKDTQRAVKFQTHHLANLAILTESIQAELLRHFDEHGTDLWYTAARSASRLAVGKSISREKDRLEELNAVPVRNSGELSDDEARSERRDRGSVEKSTNVDTYELAKQDADRNSKKSTSDKNGKLEEKDTFTEKSGEESFSGTEDKDEVEKQNDTDERKPETSTNYEKHESEEQGILTEKSPEQTFGGTENKDEVGKQDDLGERKPKTSTDHEKQELEEQGTLTQKNQKESTSEEDEKLEKKPK